MGNPQQDLCHLARMHPVINVSNNDSLLSLFQKLAKGGQRVVALTNDKFKIEKILFLIWLLSNLLDTVNSFETECCSIASLGILPKPVFAVHEHQQVIDAFELMEKHNLDTIPVLNHINHFVGEISAHHLGYFLCHNNMQDFAHSAITDLLSMCHSSTLPPVSLIISKDAAADDLISQ